MLLEEREVRDDDPGAADAFAGLARPWEEGGRVFLHLLRRVSKRIEFVAGSPVPSAEILADHHVLDLDGRWLVQVYGWESLDGERRERLTDELRRWGMLHRQWTVDELERALGASDDGALLEDADRLRRDVCGEAIHRRGLIEFSNVCARNCLYCGLRRDNRSVTRYRMSGDEVLEAARNARRLGYGTVVLQSGEDPGIPVSAICRWVERIKRETGASVTLSLGEKTYAEYRTLRSAGADRYLMRFETSDAELFERLKPGGSLDRRLEKLEWLKEIGYEVGSGCLVGLPGQSLRSLAEDLMLLERLDLDMVGVGPFIPHPETPFKDDAGPPFELTMRFVALVRLVTKHTHMPATTAMGTAHPFGRQRALQAGANILMPNVTPQKYRAYYEIYPNKICITEKPSECGGCTGSMIRMLGRTVGDGPGPSLKKSARADS